MTFEIFLIGLFIVATLTGLTTEWTIVKRVDTFLQVF